MCQPIRRANNAASWLAGGCDGVAALPGVWAVRGVVGQVRPAWLMAGEDPPPDPPGSSRLIARLTPARITGMVAG
jgi:hypothetical protein